MNIIDLIRNSIIGKRLTGYIIAGFLLIINFFIFYGAAFIFGIEAPRFIALVVTLSIFIHELGHYLALELMGIPGRMVFLVVIGGAGPIRDKTVLSRYRRLSWEKMSVVILAGVIGNFVFIALSYSAYTYGIIGGFEFLRIVNLNAVLILWNLFPISRFDGGQFSRLLFDSIEENRDTRYEIALVVFFLTSSLILLFALGRFDPINLIVFFWGIHYQARHDDIRGYLNKKAIPYARQKWWAAFYLALIFLALFLVAITPTWLV